MSRILRPYYSFIPGTDKIMKFNSLSYRPQCLGKHEIARDSEYLLNLLVSKCLKDSLRNLSKPGIEFYLPEDR